MKWVVEREPSPEVDDLSEALEVSSVLAHLLFNLGYQDRDSASNFLNPSLQQLSDPYEITNLKSAAEHLSEAIDSKKRIFIFGDYDVDGITSIVQLVSILRLYAIDPSYCVPHRLNEGYGLTQVAVDRALSEGKPDLMIVVDCGTNSTDILEYLNSLGISVIVIDHHQLNSEAPKDCFLINPHVNDQQKGDKDKDKNKDKPWFNLSAAGLVFKFLHGLIKFRRTQNDPIAFDIKLSQIIDLAGMGTIADLVPLVGENRILSRYGLKHVQSNRRQGIMALLEASGVQGGVALSGNDISYRLGPRINACGRLGDASLPIELLLSDDSQFAKKTARTLNQINLDRQSIERSIVSEAEAMIKDEIQDHLGFVLYSESWHPGVVGIVASRLSYKFNKPFIVLGKEGEIAKGSGRSVHGVDLVSVIQECDSHLEKWGGHPMAVGLSLGWSQCAEFAKSFNQTLSASYKEGFPEPILKINAWLPAEALNHKLLEELSLLQPYGQEHPEPIFGLKNIVFEKAPKKIANAHQKFYVPRNKGADILEGMAWNRSDLPGVGVAIDLAVRLEWNIWQNKKSLRLSLVDWRKSLI